MEKKTTAIVEHRPFFNFRDQYTWPWTGHEARVQRKEMQTTEGFLERRPPE